MASKQCSDCGDRVEGLSAQDAWGMLKTHMAEEHGKEWDADAREWVDAGDA